MTGLGAALGGLAVVIAAIFALRYGRRASVSISARVRSSEAGLFIEARPSVKAVGAFRVKFRKGAEGSTVTVTQMWQDMNGTINEGLTYPPENSVFGDSFVDGGEELLTTTLIPIPGVTQRSVIGWTVWFEVRGAGRFRMLLAPVKVVWWLLWPIRTPVWWVLRKPVHCCAAKLPAPWRDRVSRLRPRGLSWTDQVFVPRSTPEE